MKCAAVPGTQFSVMAVQQPKRGSDDSRTLSERIDIALARNGNLLVHREELAAFNWSHVVRHYHPREIVSALDDRRAGGMSRLARCRIVEVRDEAISRNITEKAGVTNIQCNQSCHRRAW